jgi:hypothetical protein
MAAPRYTVIIPMRRFCRDEPVLASLRETPCPLSAEIIVAEGTHPARQRNAALELARGEIVVFLDNDCRITPDFWEELERAFARPEVEIVGGPVLLRREATKREKIFHALLTHPLAVGPVSARYAARGEFRRATQTGLIMCNLAARHALFARIGPHISTHPDMFIFFLPPARTSAVHSEPMAKSYIFSSESVTEGHPDKVADTISDAVLDACLAQDKHSRVACETLVKSNLVVVAGEITTKADFDYNKVVRNAIEEIGYTEPGESFNAKGVHIMNALTAQSPDIAQGVDEKAAEGKATPSRARATRASCSVSPCNETPNLMPAPIYYAHALGER